jgi:DNA primase
MRYQMSEQRRHTTAEGTPVTAYDYTQADGVVLFQIVRFQPKGFRTRQPDGQGGWIWGFADLRPTLYRLPEVVNAHTVVIVEGEKDVETLRQLPLPAGWAATTNPFGACQWLDDYSPYLQNKQVIICPDNDPPGQEHLMQVGLALVQSAADIRVATIPAGVKDVTEWVAAGGQPDQFWQLLQQAEPFGYPKSDTELRQNLQPLLGALTKLQQLRGVSYECASAPPGTLTGPQIGLVAQAVQAVFPEWVDVTANGEYTLNIMGFEALAIESLKELQAESAALQANCAALEEQLTRLTADLTAQAIANPSVIPP